MNRSDGDFNPLLQNLTIGTVHIYIINANQGLGISNISPTVFE